MTGVKTNKIVSVALLTLGALSFIPAWYTLNMFLLLGAGWYQKYPLQYEVPANYVGWVEVRFNHKEAQRLKTSGPYAVVPIDDSGVVITSSPIPAIGKVGMLTGKEDRYLYQHNKAPIPAERIQAVYEEADSNTCGFFVGTVAEYYDSLDAESAIRPSQDDDGISPTVPGNLRQPAKQPME